MVVEKTHSAAVAADNSDPLENRIVKIATAAVTNLNLLRQIAKIYPTVSQSVFQNK